MQVKDKRFTVYNFCQFKKCRNTSDKCHLYRFPGRGKHRHEEWIKRSGKQEYLQGWTDSSIRKAGLCGDHFKPEMFLESILPSSYKRLSQNAVPEYYCEKNPEPERPAQEILPCEPVLQKANEISNFQVFLEENEIVCKEECIEINMEEDAEREFQSRDSNEICTSGSHQNPIPEPHWETQTDRLFQTDFENSNQVFLVENEILCKEEYIEINMEADSKIEAQSKDSNEICTSGSYQNPISELEKTIENSNQVLREDDEILCEEEYTHIGIKMEDTKRGIIEPQAKVCHEVVPNSKSYSKPTTFYSRGRDLTDWNLIESPYTRRVPPLDIQTLKGENLKLRKELSLWKKNVYTMNQQLHRTRERRNFYKKQLQNLRRQTVDEFLDKEGCSEDLARTMVHLQLHKKYEAYSEAEKDLAKLIFHHSPLGYIHLRNAGCHLPHENHVRKWLKLI